MTGVISPGVSAGSSQVGASDTCTAHVSCPSAAHAGAPRVVNVRTRAVATNTATCRFTSALLLSDCDANGSLGGDSYCIDERPGAAGAPSFCGMGGGRGPPYWSIGQYPRPDVPTQPVSDPSTITSAGPEYMTSTLP